MELELKITGDPYPEVAKQRRRVFGTSGGSVGRALDNYWLLPDPKHYLSGHHCEIIYRKGVFLIRDTSRNGVFVNGSKNRLGYGRKMRLKDGDDLIFATYRLRARIISLEAAAKAAAESVARDHEEPRKVDDDIADNDTGEHNAANEADNAHTHTRVLPDAADDLAQSTEVAGASAIDSHPEEGIAEAAGPEDRAPGDADDNESDDRDKESALVSTGNIANEYELSPAANDDQPGQDEVEAVADPGNESVLVSTGNITDEYEASPSEGDAPAVVSAPGPRDEGVRSARRILQVDRAQLRAKGHLPPKSVERLINNQFRHIKRPLIKNALGKGVEPVENGNLVMITSSLPGEGKSFSSINLAFSIARERDLEVVLIDADVAKKRISEIFDVVDEPGLLNALADDEKDVESFILPTDVEGLYILPAGKCGDEDGATEMLASSRMDEIVEQLGARSQQRIALFDSPPLLLTNEARVLASAVGQVLLIVREGETPQQAVTEAIALIDDDKPIGLVLNQSKANAPGSYYGYGSYGYGAYGDEKTTK